MSFFVAMHILTNNIYQHFCNKWCDPVYPYLYYYQLKTWMFNNRDVKKVSCICGDADVKTSGEFCLCVLYDRINTLFMYNTVVLFYLFISSRCRAHKSVGMKLHRFIFYAYWIKKLKIVHHQSKVKNLNHYWLVL